MQDTDVIGFAARTQHRHFTGPSAARAREHQLADAKAPDLLRRRLGLHVRGTFWEVVGLARKLHSEMGLHAGNITADVAINDSAFLTAGKVVVPHHPTEDRVPQVQVEMFAGKLLSSRQGALDIKPLEN